MTGRDDLREVISPMLDLGHAAPLTPMVAAIGLWPGPEVKRLCWLSTHCLAFQVAAPDVSPEQGGDEGP